MTLIYPGSFDPVTLGHIDIATRGSGLADRLIVAVLENVGKKSLFSVEERLAFLRKAFGHIKNIEIASFSGLLADYAKGENVTAILRGLRTSGDFESESKYAVYNRLLSVGAETGPESGSKSGIETIFITASPSLSFISSSIVREAAFHIYTSNLSDDALCNMVDPNVKAALKSHFK